MNLLKSPLPIALILAVPLWLAACRDGAEVANTAELANITAVDEHEAPKNVTAKPVTDMANAATPLGFDPTSEAAKGEPGARVVLDGWARALEARDWVAARDAWGHGGADSGLDAAAFARAYDRYKAIAISIGDGEADAGAGSLYYRAPVTFIGTLRDGRQVRMEGPVTLRRVNDIDGASAADLRWHISMSDLKSSP
ncbi:hypothetical protein BH10PSE13_BH10PSE13_24290 [soil metagenome]